MKHLKTPFITVKQLNFLFFIFIVAFVPASVSTFILTIENVDSSVDSDSVELINTTLVYSNPRFTGEPSSKPTINKGKEAIFFLNPFEGFGSK